MAGCRSALLLQDLGCEAVFAGCEIFFSFVEYCHVGFENDVARFFHTKSANSLLCCYI